MRIAVAVAIAPWLLVVGTRPAAAAGVEERIAVIAGCNVGDPADEPLLWAEHDAERFRTVLIELAAVRADRAILVRGGGPERILRALREARGRAAELNAAGRRVTLLFYYSGHGDETSLHTAGGNLALAELRQAIADIPAALRVVILDACRMGQRAKGITRGPGFALAVAPDPPRGTIELRASAGGEAAQESHELRGSVFTHYLVSGLRGDADADRDGQVTLSELYAHTYRRTLLRTSSGPALQHAALAVNLRGIGEVVLSYPGQTGAYLEVPGRADHYLVFASRTATVMGELSGGRPARLALPRGEYLVVRRAGRHTAVASVDLTWGGGKAIEDRDFRPVSREELAARGGHLALRPRRLEPQVGLEVAPGGAEAVALRAGARLSYTRGALVAGVGLAYVGGGLATTGFVGDQQALTGGPDVGVRIFLGLLALEALVGVEARLVWQDLERRDAARAAAAGLATAEARRYGAVGPRGTLRLGVPLGRGLVVTLEGSTAGLVRREDDGGARPLGWHPVVGTSVGLGRAF
jgi:hypothetical protein